MNESDPEDLTDWELGDQLTDNLQASHGENKARIYVTFTHGGRSAPVDAPGVSNPDRRTFGPYHNASITSDGSLYATTDDDDCCLATLGEAGWTVHDGLEEIFAPYACVAFATRAPRQQKTDRLP